jgi:hypothetical protein
MGQVRDFHTFRVHRDNAILYMESSRDNYHAQLKTSPYLAGEVDVNNVPDLVKVYQKLVKEYGKDNVQLIRLKITIEEHIEEALGAGEYLEERRRLALSKLQADDIEALGLKPLAAYNKLKNHNVER